MTNAEVIQTLQGYPSALVAKIAEESGLPEGTVRKIFYGETANPRGDTLDALRGYFLKNPQ